LRHPAKLFTFIPDFACSGAKEISEESEGCG